MFSPDLTVQLTLSKFEKDTGVLTIGRGERAILVRTGHLRFFEESVVLFTPRDEPVRGVILSLDVIGNLPIQVDELSEKGKTELRQWLDAQYVVYD